MPKVKVNHNGSIEGKDGKTYVYEMGKAVDLPADAVTALGDSVTRSEKEAPQEPKGGPKKGPEKTSYEELQDKAKALGLPTKGSRQVLEASIAEAEAKNMSGAPVNKMTGTPPENK